MLNPDYKSPNVLSTEDQLWKIYQMLRDEIRKSSICIPDATPSSSESARSVSLPSTSSQDDFVPENFPGLSSYLASLPVESLAVENSGNLGLQPRIDTSSPPSSAVLQ